MYGIVIPILFAAVLLTGVEAWTCWGGLVTSVPQDCWYVSLVVFVTWGSLHTIRKLSQ